MNKLSNKDKFLYSPLDAEYLDICGERIGMAVFLAFLILDWLLGWPV